MIDKPLVVDEVGRRLSVERITGRRTIRLGDSGAQLALQLARAEKALRELALDVHVIGNDVRELAGLNLGEQAASAPLAAVPPVRAVN